MHHLALEMALCRSVEPDVASADDSFAAEVMVWGVPKFNDDPSALRRASFLPRLPRRHAVPPARKRDHGVPCGLLERGHRRIG